MSSCSSALARPTTLHGEIGTWALSGCGLATHSMVLSADRFHDLLGLLYLHLIQAADRNKNSALFHMLLLHIPECPGLRRR